MNEILITLLITIGLFGYSFLVGLACFYWGRYYERKTGHWINREIEDTLRWKECSECHSEYPNMNGLNYCPNCGSQMEEFNELKMREATKEERESVSNYMKNAGVKTGIKLDIYEKEKGEE